MNEQLKPCPFCGGQALILKDSHNSDANLLETIDNHAKLAGDMMYALFQVSEWKDDGRYSAKECGKKAYNSLLNLAYDLIGYLDTNDLKKLRDSINEYSLEGDEQC